jgi:hypothetical protein
VSILDVVVGLLFHVIQITRAQLPGCPRIDTRLFSVSSLHCWLVHQLLVYTSTDNKTLPRGERAEVSNRSLQRPSAIGQMLVLLSDSAQIQ